MELLSDVLVGVSAVLVIFNFMALSTDVINGREFDVRCVAFLALNLANIAVIRSW